MDDTGHMDDPSEVYVLFGFTFHHSQEAEQRIIELAVALLVKGTEELTIGDIVAQYKGTEGRDFGVILRYVREIVEVPSSLESTVQQAVKNRDRLAHSFFTEHSDNLFSAAGHEIMLDELRIMIGILSEVHEQCKTIWLALWQKIRISPDEFDRQMEIIRQMAHFGADRSVH